MRLILAILLLTATNAFAVTPDPVAPSAPTYDCYPCFADTKDVLFGKFPLPNTMMKCVLEIKNGKEMISFYTFDGLMRSSKLMTTFETKDRIIFYFQIIK